MKYAIQITDEAKEMIREVTDRRIRQKIMTRIDQLAENPHQQGKPLHE